MSSPVINTRSHRPISQLAKILKVDQDSLQEWLDGSPEQYCYKTFKIKKRSGSMRTIDAPNDNLKELQKIVYKRLLKDAAVQSAANGFVPTRSLINNVQPHLASKVVIKIDLKDFFGSITSEMVYKFWQADGWDTQCSSILTNICCKDSRLPQGAPTSPALSNLVNRGFDGQLSILVKKYAARYTRYADDITISFPRKSEVKQKIRPFLNEIRELIENEGYRIQLKKGIKFLRQHQRQIVTGLVINTKIQLPRPTRHRIRALRHLNKSGKLSEREQKRLEGYERLQNMIDKHNAAKQSYKTKASTNNKQPLALHVAGDIVQGNKVTVGGDIGNILSISQDTNRTQIAQNPSMEYSKKKWSIEAKLALIALGVAILAIIVTVAIPEVRYFTCNQIGILCAAETLPR